MNWIQRKIYLYNVTFGLYMLDWWERFLFSPCGLSEFGNLNVNRYFGGCVDVVCLLQWVPVCFGVQHKAVGVRRHSAGPETWP
ncbi:hypothetical protein Sango_1835500 [Sesamum angolense]|uniref:Uncharacterized protein n=1 Tax=Sesamum angolense TaxID=2727404 RepID=A0AAE2BQ38_9LAMI|nr:hypothetical protein Sango_1835500 [Sesamum angolense]